MYRLWLVVGGDVLSRGGRRRPPTHDTILSAAIGIADAEGIDAVSIRRIAAEIDARPMSLYIHFENKDALLTAMANAIVEEVLLDQPIPENWRDAVAASARRSYAVFVKHSWVIPIFTSRPFFGPASAEVAKQNAQAVESLSLEPTELWSLQGAVNDYVVGRSMRAGAVPIASQAEQQISDEELAKTPELGALPKWMRSRSSVERFEFGLKMVLDGFERRVAELDS